MDSSGHHLRFLGHVHVNVRNKFVPANWYQQFFTLVFLIYAPFSTRFKQQVFMAQLSYLGQRWCEVFFGLRGHGVEIFCYCGDWRENEGLGGEPAVERCASGGGCLLLRFVQGYRQLHQYCRAAT